MQQAQMAYDRAITVFSPDGRLFQVEYAREAVRRGSTTIGIKFKDGVALIIDKKVRSNLIEPKSIEKIYMIDEHIGAASSGLVADARMLVDYARVNAQVEKVTYNEKVGVEVLTKKVSDYVQQYTQYGGARPFGASLLIAGVDDEPHLFETEPSGAFLGYKADCIGAGRDIIMPIFEKEYKDTMSMDEAIVLALKGLKKAAEDPNAMIIAQIGIVTKDKGFRILEESETETYLNKI